MSICFTSSAAEGGCATYTAGVLLFANSPSLPRENGVVAADLSGSERAYRPKERSCGAPSYLFAS